MNAFYCGRFFPFFLCRVNRYLSVVMFRAVSGMFVTPMIASSIYIEKDNSSKLFLFVFLGNEAPRIVGKKFMFFMFHD